MADTALDKCGGSGTHKGWKRGFLLIGGLWFCRACKDRAHG